MDYGKDLDSGYFRDDNIHVVQGLQCSKPGSVVGFKDGDRGRSDLRSGSALAQPGRRGCQQRAALLQRVRRCVSAPL